LFFLENCADEFVPALVVAGQARIVDSQNNDAGFVRNSEDVQLFPFLHHHELSNGSLEICRRQSSPQEGAVSLEPDRVVHMLQFVQINVAGGIEVRANPRLGLSDHAAPDESDAHHSKKKAKRNRNHEEGYDQFGCYGSHRSALGCTAKRSRASPLEGDTHHGLAGRGMGATLV